jgi:hypothetical protein
MMVLYQILTRMFDNSTILYEDINDQILIKEQEQKAVHATHNAMQSARSIIKGNPDKRALFDTAMEAVAEDVGNKMGELERFMHASNNFMNAIDLPELISHTQEGYEALAIELALNSKKFSDIRLKLSNNRLTTALFDTPRFTKNLEAAFIKMHERYKAGFNPDHIFAA